MKTLIYCTKAKPIIWGYETFIEYGVGINNEQIGGGVNEFPLNGRVVAVCEVGEIEELECSHDFDGYPFIGTESFSEIEIEERTCLDWWDIWGYLNGKNGYAYHLKNIKPVYMELGELKRIIGIPQFPCLVGVTKAPQSYMYVYYKGEKCLLMSVKSKWCEKILNGEKTVEVRKTRAKEIKG
jgi:hypothetical protein